MVKADGQLDGRLEVTREDGVKVVVKPTLCHNGRVPSWYYLRYIDPRTEGGSEDLLQTMVAWAHVNLVQNTPWVLTLVSAQFL